MSAPPRILYCHCAYARVVPPEVKEGVLRGLSESGEAFDAVADLCEMSAKRDPALKELADQESLRIVACYPRAVKWLFSAAGSPLPETVRVHNMRTEAADEVLVQLQDPDGGEPIGAGPAEKPTSEETPESDEASGDESSPVAEDVDAAQPAEEVQS